MFAIILVVDFVVFELGNVEVDVGQCKMDVVHSSSVNDLWVLIGMIVYSTPYY